jgi:hypothetical protein
MSSGAAGVCAGQGGRARAEHAGRVPRRPGHRGGTPDQIQLTTEYLRPTPRALTLRRSGRRLISIANRYWPPQLSSSPDVDPSEDRT